MPEILDQNDIYDLCKKYYSIYDEIILGIHPSEITEHIEDYILELTFCVFALSELIKQGLIFEAKNMKLQLDDFANDLKNSLHLSQDFFSIHQFFYKGFNGTFRVKKKNYKINLKYKLEIVSSDIKFETIESLNINWNLLRNYYLEILNLHQLNPINIFSTIYENSLNKSTSIDNPTFSNSLSERKKRGVYYTPDDITYHINHTTLFAYISEKLNHKITNPIDLMQCTDEQCKKLVEILCKISILDLACGCSDFLVNAARFLFTIQIGLYARIANCIDALNLKKQIIENNIFGVDIQDKAIMFSKARFFFWYLESLSFSNYEEDIVLKFNLKRGNSLIGSIKDVETEDQKKNYFMKLKEIIKDNSFTYDEFNNLSPFHWFNSFEDIFDKGGFDIIVSNPPYVEIKKIRNVREKQILSKQYESAYKLYDLSILFIERGLQLLAPDGYLSFIITNKFLSTDFGYKIREIILSQTRIESLVDVSYLPIFKSIATYPIIITLQKLNSSSKVDSEDFDIKIYSKLPTINDLLEPTTKPIIVRQSDYEKYPNKIFVITEDFNFFNHIEKNQDIVRLGKLGDFKYRVFGFTNWISYLDFLISDRFHPEDKSFIGTANIDSYIVNDRKSLRLAGKKIERNFLDHSKFEAKLWDIFSKSKLLIREIAKELTVSYDNGKFVNLTGIYMFIPINNKILKPLLVILNSKVIRKYYQILFSCTHMAGGYLRFNGSYLKQIPILYSNKLESSLSILADYLMLLQKARLITFYDGLDSIYDFFIEVADFLVLSLYFPNEIDMKYVETVTEFFEPITDEYDIYIDDTLTLQLIEHIIAVYNKLDDIDILTKIAKSMKFID